MTCPATAPDPSCADAALYRDEPQYGNPMDLIDQVRAWASTESGFADLWLDRDHHGWVTVGFHGADVDVAALQHEVATRFPGEGVVVVTVPYTLADLQALMDRVRPALAAADATPTGGVALDVPRGLLSLSGVPASPRAQDALRQFAGEPLCVDTVDPSAFVPEGDQPTEGQGWRLLGDAEGAGEVPAVDWQTEIVVWFGAVHGSSCPVRLDGVVVDGTTLHGQIVVPGAGPVTVCTADAIPHSFVVAVERTLLPAGPFVVQLTATDPPPGAPEERTVVDADLSVPGATASADQLHPDPDAGPHPGPLIEDGYDQAPEPGARYMWHPRPQCAGIVIGPFDGTLWRLADGEAAWTEVDGQEVTLFPVDAGHGLVVSSPGTEHVFVRAPASTCGS